MVKDPVFLESVIEKGEILNLKDRIKINNGKIDVGSVTTMLVKEILMYLPNNWQTI